MACVERWVRRLFGAQNPPHAPLETGGQTHTTAPEDILRGGSVSAVSRPAGA